MTPLLFSLALAAAAGVASNWWLKNQCKKTGAVPKVAGVDATKSLPALALVGTLLLAPFAPMLSLLFVGAGIGVSLPAVFPKLLGDSCQA